MQQPIISLQDKTGWISLCSSDSKEANQKRSTACVYVQLHVLACMPLCTLMPVWKQHAWVHEGCRCWSMHTHICMYLYVHPKVAEGQCLYKCVDTCGSHLHPPRYMKVCTARCLWAFAMASVHLWMHENACLDQSVHSVPLVAKHTKNFAKKQKINKKSKPKSTNKK